MNNKVVSMIRTSLKVDRESAIDQYDNIDSFPINYFIT